MLNIKHPSTEIEFISMMEKVDQFLRDNDVPPHARPIRGWSEVSNALSMGLSMFPRNITKPREGVFTGDDLTLRIFSWFDERYAEKLKIDFGPGRIILLIRNDPWEVLLPRIYGQAQLFISAIEKSSDSKEDLKLKRIPKQNILDSMPNFPHGLAKSLSPEELDQTALFFIKALQDMTSIREKYDVLMFKEVMSDCNHPIFRTDFYRVSPSVNCS